MYIFKQFAYTGHLKACMQILEEMNKNPARLYSGPPKPKLKLRLEKNKRQITKFP